MSNIRKDVAINASIVVGVVLATAIIFKATSLFIADDKSTLDREDYHPLISKINDLTVQIDLIREGLERENRINKNCDRDFGCAIVKASSPTEESELDKLNKRVNSLTKQIEEVKLASAPVFPVAGYGVDPSCVSLGIKRGDLVRHKAMKSYKYLVTTIYRTGKDVPCIVAMRIFPTLESKTTYADLIEVVPQED